MAGKRIKAIFVEYDDATIFNITDLERTQYEEFIELTEKLRLMYQSLIREQKLRDHE